MAKNICPPVSVLGRNDVAMFIFIPVAYHHYFACSRHLNIQAVLTSTSSLSSAHTWCSCFRWVTSFLLKSLHRATVDKQGESNSNNYSKAQLIEGLNHSVKLHWNLSRNFSVCTPSFSIYLQVFSNLTSMLSRNGRVGTIYNAWLIWFLSCSMSSMVCNVSYETIPIHIVVLSVNYIDSCSNV